MLRVVEVELRVDVKDCSNLARALSVDEVNLPRGIRTKITCNGDRELVYVVEAALTDPRQVLSIWNTIDDLLRSLKALLSLDREAL